MALLKNRFRYLTNIQSKRKGKRYIDREREILRVGKRKERERERE